MTLAIELQEYRSDRLMLAPKELSELIDAAANRLQFRPTEIPGETEVVATSYVGTIVTDSVQIVIQPKLAIRNFLYLLEVGGDAIDLAEELAGIDAMKGLLPVVATLLVRLGDRATARGLHHRYRAFGEPLIAMRGRIDLAAQMSRGGLVSPVECRFDEFTADVPENQFLKAAIRRVARMGGVPAVTRRAAARLLLALAEVSDVEVRPDDVDRIVINRLNRHYLPALQLSRLVLQEASVVVKHGSKRVSVFLVDMNKVFESFVEHRLRAALRPELTLEGQRRSRLDMDGHVTIIPDYLVRREGRVVFVADAKYKFSSDGLARQADYYQLLAYCTAFGLPEGMLIYADIEDDLPPSEVIVRSNGVRLVTHRLSLGGTPNEIDAAVAATRRGVPSAVRPLGRYGERVSMVTGRTCSPLAGSATTSNNRTNRATLPTPCYDLGDGRW